MIKESIEQLRREKEEILEPVRNENHFLREKLEDLKDELEDLNRISELPP